jgi:hypothetical protein
MKLLLILVTLLNLSFVYCKSGIDISVPLAVDDWKCLINPTNDNITYAIARVYRSIGAVDENAPSNFIAATNAGLTNLDGYVFPCIASSAYNVANNITCLSAIEQVRTVVSYLTSNEISIKRTFNNEIKSSKATINRLWLDIEDEVPSKYFDVDPKVNQIFIQEMTDAIEKERISMGIYTTVTYWDNIMDNIGGYSQFPLWYPRYDDINSMDFFTPFGGWTSCDIKQTGGDLTLCNVRVDTDYMIN